MLWSNPYSDNAPFSRLGLDVQLAAQMLDLAVDGYESEMTAIHKADRFRKNVGVKTFAMINAPCVG
ncbi:hypothetical protein P4I20_27915 [Paenibacillus graminis]